MNNLFVVLPLADSTTADEEAVYLRSLRKDNPQQDFLNLIRELVEAFRFVKEETFNVYYDHERFIELYKFSSTPNHKKERPNVTALLNLLPAMKKIDSLALGHTIKVDDVEQTSGILKAYVNCAHKETDVLLDSKILLHPQKLRVLDYQGGEVDLKLVPSVPIELFYWFVRNRSPKRILTQDYKKHSKKEKEVDGKRVSALTYSYNEAEELLHWAIGKIRHNRCYFIDVKKRRLLIFWSQNEPVPTFHFYDVEMSDEKEIQKMWKDCGRDIVSKIQMISEKKQ